jgi:acetyl-CoA carboxylase carboxyltransferase component
MARRPLHPIGSVLESEAASGRASSSASPSTREIEALLLARRAALREGWGPAYRASLRERGKLSTWERVEALADSLADILPFGSFVNWGRSFEGSSRQAPGAGVVTAFCRVEGRWVVVVANDNLVASGAWWPLTPEKIQRAQEIALRLRLPVVYLVESSGLFLPEQARSFPGRNGAGAIFRMNALLSAQGVPQVAGVLGPCIAGGGYMPIISDRVIMTEQAYMVIAGAALLKGAKAQRLTSETIGGPEVHVHQSGCADRRVPDDATCILEIRAEIARLPTSAVPWHRGGDEPIPPCYAASDLSSLFPADHRAPYAMREVLARLLDASLFHEILPDRGREIIVGLGRVSGLWAGFVANNVEATPHPERPGATRPGGILHQEGIAKVSTFVRSCDEDGIPLIWLQDVAGFDIGVEAEARGLLGYGSSLIHSISTNRAPMVTVLLRRASGAGYYAQAGLPFGPILQLATPLTRLAVMEGRTAAIASWIHHLDDDLEVASSDPAERARVERGMAEVQARVERDMDPWAAASRMDVDEILALDEIPRWLGAVVEMCYQATGARRLRNPRIWSLHDLETLCSEP